MALLIAKRIAIGALLVLVVLTITFLAIRLVPGDPALMLVGGESGTTSPEQLASIRAALGLDQPLHVQYLNFVGSFLTGDLGQSFRSDTPVVELVLRRLPNSLELIAYSSILAVTIGIAMGSWAARRGGAADTFVAAVTSVGVATPGFVLGALLVIVFALQLRWLPAGGLRPWSNPVAHLSGMLLPSIALSVAFLAVVARMTRSSVVETMGQDWVRTARAIGLSERQVYRRHVLRNALTPVTSVIGLQISSLFGATVVVGRVFNYPGLSSLLIDAVQSRDYPVVQGVVILVSVIFIVANIIVDIIYGVLDPRVREA
mgnify:FL=1